VEQRERGRKRREKTVHEKMAKGRKGDEGEEGRDGLCPMSHQNPLK